MTINFFRTLKFVLGLSLVGVILSSSAAEAKKRKKGQTPRPTIVSQGPLSAPPSGQNLPLFDFWSSVFRAREKLQEGKAKEALKLLSDLPPPPENILNKNQNFYRRLYKEALETGLKSSRSLSEPTGTWERRLWAYFPDLENASTGDVPDGIRPEDKVARLHLLYQRGLFERIPNFVSSAEILRADLSLDIRCRALLEYALAVRKSGKKEDALRGLEQLEELSCDGDSLERGLYWKGALELGQKRLESVETTYRRLGQKFPTGRYADDAYYQLYQIYRSRHQEANAARALSELLNLPQGDMKEKYLWEEAFEAYQRDDYDKARSFLDQIVGSNHLGREAQSQALYWKGRIEEIRSKKKLGGKASDLYRQLLKSYPFSFYALLAEERLGEKFSRPPVPPWKDSPPSDPSLAEALGVVDRLNHKRDHESALEVLDYLSYQFPKCVDENPDVMAERWMDSGDFNRAMEIAAGHFDQSPLDINLDSGHHLLRALYPTAYLKEVTAEAKSNQLPLPLIFGVMREESLFQPAVRSHAGAIGLMQLMPETARRKAHQLGLSYSTEELTRPAYNIQLGSAYLKTMMDLFDNRAPSAVMAYNAGPGRVVRWNRSRGGQAIDEFIETIPFSETRGYVKRVLRSAAIYSHLLEPSKPFKPFAEELF